MKLLITTLPRWWDYRSGRRMRNRSCNRRMLWRWRRRRKCILIWVTWTRRRYVSYLFIIHSRHLGQKVLHPLLGLQPIRQDLQVSRQVLRPQKEHHHRHSQRQHQTRLQDPSLMPGWLHQKWKNSKIEWYMVVLVWWTRSWFRRESWFGTVEWVLDAETREFAIWEEGEWDIGVG